MWISELILDGFKSYATRTVISGFDPQFNAITGLNGSGKSNILDAICFVLGISNLSQVRAGNLQDLVYKQGQAGVTKASVTIVFNNEDPEQSPVGYEQFPQITVTRQVQIGGRNKYMINGHNAQLNRVQNLFHSVQLNVNNPHFLIMQGRITKVLNMKPAEVLGMIEEAAGTRMFESKKQNALRTIEKKQKKVQEIDDVLQNEITPTLESLRSERRLYIQWQRNQGEIEKLSRFRTAFNYRKAETAKAAAEEALEELLGEQQAVAGSKAELERELKAAEARIEQLSGERDALSGPEFQQLEQEADELSKELVKVTTAWKHQRDALAADEAQMAEVTAAIAETSEAIADKEKAKSGMSSTYEEKRAEHERLEQELAELQRQYQAVSSGMGGDAGGGGNQTVAAQLDAAKQKVSALKSELKQKALQIKHLKKEVAAKEKELKASVGDAALAQLQKEYESAVAAADKVKASMAKLDFDEAEEERLQKERAARKAAVRQLGDRVAQMTASLQSVSFEYSDPAKNFDRSAVKGLVANLINVVDPKYATALEVVAGSRLYNVVVQDEVTGKQLLEKGRLKKRVTIIPLNKVQPRAVAASKVAAAERLQGKENASLALSLVTYDDEVDAAMRYVFGGSFVCASADAAKRVAYNKNIATKAVTLEGDVFDPSGTMTGGSRRGGGQLLTQLQAVNAARAELIANEKALAEATKRLDGLGKHRAAFQKRKQEWEIASHKAALVKARIDQNASHQQVARLEEMRAALAAAEAAVGELEASEAEWRGKIDELGAQLAAAKAAKDKELAALGKRREKVKKQLAQSKKLFKSQQSAADKIELEATELNAELATLREQLAALESGIEQLEREAADGEAAVAAAKAAFEEKHAAVNGKRAKMGKLDDALGEETERREQLQQQVTDCELEAQQHEHAAKERRGEAAAAERLLSELLKKNAWIETERQFFGKANTDYDFKAVKMADVTARLNQFKGEQEKLSKSINTKVLAAYDRAEKEYDALSAKRKIILNDKEKIEAVIADLDVKKSAALRTAWEKVNKDFGAIFGALLPGASSRLEPVDGDDLNAGLEIMVSFSGLSKNLTELSGGQRSLVALSLVLSMLLFRPCPFYILDEVDAALDLSHTQNIGSIIANHFTGSQFLVVSLKQGMFDSASVVFRTRFVDGVSTVTRTVNSKA